MARTARGIEVLEKARELLSKACAPLMSYDRHNQLCCR